MLLRSFALVDRVPSSGQAGGIRRSGFLVAVVTADAVGLLLAAVVPGVETLAVVAAGTTAGFLWLDLKRLRLCAGFSRFREPRSNLVGTHNSKRLGAVVGAQHKLAADVLRGQAPMLRLADVLVLGIPCQGGAAALAALGDVWHVHRFTSGRVLVGRASAIGAAA